MFTIAIISFREFLEAFLIIGIFLGISKKLHLKQETEISFAAAVGMITSIILLVILYVFGDAARMVLTESRANLLESYLFIFSGFFLVYVIFSLHKRISQDKKEIIQHAKTKMENQIFDISLFTIIIFLIVREGFEIALFTASTSLFSSFSQNFLGLLMGSIFAGAIGSFAFITYTKFPIKKIFKITEYMIILLGASMVQVGFTELLKYQFGVFLGNIASFKMNFLPGENTLFGNFLRTFTGIDGEFSLPRLLIMLLYIVCIYVLVKYRNVQGVENEK